MGKQGGASMSTLPENRIVNYPMLKIELPTGNVSFDFDGWYYCDVPSKERQYISHQLAFTFLKLDLRVKELEKEKYTFLRLDLRVKKLEKENEQLRMKNRGELK